MSHTKMQRNNSRGPVYGRLPQGESSSYMEGENDRMTEELYQKTSALKHMSIEIGNEVRSQNSMINGMDSDFDSSRNVLEATMRRLGIISGSGGNRFMCYLILFSFAVFLVIYWLYTSR